MRKLIRTSNQLKCCKVKVKKDVKRSKNLNKLSATSSATQKAKWIAVRRRKLGQANFVRVKKIKQIQLRMTKSSELKRVLKRKSLSNSVQTDTEMDTQEAILDLPSALSANSQQNIPITNTVMSVINYERRDRETELHIHNAEGNAQDPGSTFKTSSDQNEDSFIISPYRKPQESRKCVNLAILEWRYVFIDKIEGTPFFYCFDIKEFQHFYCKVSNHSCAKLIEAYFRLRDNVNINQLHKVIRVNRKTYLLFPRPQDDMLSYLRHRKLLPEKETRFLFRQMCEIVRCCHEKGVVLRDLKLRKFVFDNADKKHVQLESLIDAVVLKDPENDLIQEKRGCPLYVAPEILKTSRPYHGKAADMWSLGVILYTMLVGRYPFNDPEHSLLFVKITNGLFFIPENMSPKARCLIRCLLQEEPSKRMTAEDIFYHPWMTTDDTNAYELSKTDQCVPDNDYVKTN